MTGCNCSGRARTRTSSFVTTFAPSAAAAWSASPQPPDALDALRERFHLGGRLRLAHAGLEGEGNLLE